MNESKPAQFHAWDLCLESLHQVVLFNDDVNTGEYVVACMMRIFGHPVELAVKIMAEAHVRGRAIAEVEARILADTHALQLRHAGLQVQVEKIKVSTMPIYRLNARSHAFPDPEEATEFGGLLAVGGDFSLERLVSAYSRGIFPWPVDEIPRAWWSPDPRFVLYPEVFKVPRSLDRTLKKQRFSYSVDRCFERIIAQCRLKKRPDQEGTWITEELQRAYCRLHQAGYAHSIETWLDGQLVGGLYGVSLGRCFYGESMFASAPDASKCAFAKLVGALSRQGCCLIDCQVRTEHLARFGAQEVPRKQFLRELARAIDPVKGDLNWMSIRVALETHDPGTSEGWRNTGE